MDTSFKMDRWMLKFLSEFAQPVEDKDAAEIPSAELWSMENIGISPQYWT
jgi:hypothetical protein